MPRIAFKQLQDGAQQISGTGIITIASGDYLRMTSAPVNGLDLANKDYVDSVAAGLDPKESVYATTIAPITGTYNATGGANASGQFTGVDLTNAGDLDHTTGWVVGKRVLIKDQADAKQNGIYYFESGTAASATITRATDSDGTPSNEVSGGNFTFIEQGTSYANTGWVLQGAGTLTLNTDNLSWVQFSSIAAYTGGNGVNITGSVISADVDGTTISNTGGGGDQLAVLKVPNTLTLLSTGGLEFTAGTSFDGSAAREVGINLDGTSNGTSGLKLTVSGLTLSDNIGGNGISYASGVLDLDVNTTTFAFSAGVLNLASTVAGAGLTLTAGVLDINYNTTSFTVTTDQLSLATTVAGDGLSLSAGALNVNTDGVTMYTNGSDQLAVKSSATSGQVMVSQGAGSAAWGAVALGNSNAVSGTLGITNGGTGVTTTPSNGSLLIGNGTGYTVTTLTAGTGITITNGAGSITIASTATHTEKRFRAAVANNDPGSDYVIAVDPFGSDDPLASGIPVVTINGVGQYVGDGTKTADVYFSSDGGTTASSLNALGGTEDLYFNPTAAGWSVATTDIVEIRYIVA